MTRQQQNAIILQELNDMIIDTPNVQDAISKAFDQWFAALLTPAAPPAPVAEEEQAA